MSSIVEYEDLIGVPFEWGGRGPDSYDCYGVCRELLRRCGKYAPDYNSPDNWQASSELIGVSKNEWRACEEKPGAVLVLNVLGLHSHVGFIVSKYKFVHAWHKAGGVVVEDMIDWKHRKLGTYEYVG